MAALAERRVVAGMNEQSTPTGKRGRGRPPKDKVVNYIKGVRKGQGIILSLTKTCADFKEVQDTVEQVNTMFQPGTSKIRPYDTLRFHLRFKADNLQLFRTNPDGSRGDPIPAEFDPSTIFFTQTVEIAGKFWSTANYEFIVFAGFNNAIKLLTQEMFNQQRQEDIVQFCRELNARNGRLKIPVPPGTDMAEIGQHPCPECGKMFIPGVEVRADAIYCSRKCADNAGARRRRAIRNQQRETNSIMIE